MVPPNCSWENGAEPRAVGEARGQPGPLLKLVRGAVELVGAGLGDHVDEAARTAPELRRGAVGHHLKFFDGVQAYREGRALAAALLAEERIVVIRAIDGDVVVDAFLAVDGNLIAVRTLHDRDSRRERDQAEEVAPVVRQVAYRARYRDRWSSPLGTSQESALRRLRTLPARRSDKLNGRVSEMDWPTAKSKPFAHQRAEVGGLGCHFVRTKREQHAAKPALCIGLEHAREVGAQIEKGYIGIRDRATGGVGDQPLDGSGIGLGLAQRSGTNNEKHNKGDEISRVHNTSPRRATLTRCNTGSRLNSLIGSTRNGAVLQSELAASRAATLAARRRVLLSI